MLLRIKVKCFPQSAAQCRSMIRPVSTAISKGETQMIDSKKVPDYRPPQQAASEYEKAKEFREMPGPKGIPLFGTILEYLKPGGLSFSKMFEVFLARTKEYGPIYTEKYGFLHTVVISDPTEYAKVLQTEGRFPKRAKVLPWAYYRKYRGLSPGLVSSSGEEWYRARKNMMKKMLRPPEVSEFCDDMNDVADEFIAKFRETVKFNGDVNDLQHEIFSWAMESICTFVFDLRIGALTEDRLAEEFMNNIGSFFKATQNLMYDLPFYQIYPTKTFRQLCGATDSLLSIGQIYADRKISELTENFHKYGDIPHRSGLLEFLLREKDFTPQQANHHTLEVLSGGVETVAYTVLWTLYCLSKNPRVQEKLLEETNKVFKPGEAITSKNISKLQYVNACIKEAFRIYPITFATSRFVQDREIVLGGYKVPVGAHIQAHTYGMGNDPNIFESPEEYRPERWMGKVDPKHNLVHSIVWGHGARMCIGRRLAEQEIRILITKINQTFKLSFYGDEPKPILSTVLVPDKPLMISFIERKKEVTKTELNAIDKEGLLHEEAVEALI